MRGIGFDLGPNTVTAVVVNAGLQGLKVESVRVSATPETGEGRDRALRALKQAALPAAIAVPVHQVSSRLVALPFAQQAKWDAVLPAELEGQIPFELDEVVIDGATLGRDGHRTNVLAVAVPKPTIKSRLDEDRKSTRLNSSHQLNSYAVFCLKKKKGIRYTGDAAKTLSKMHRMGESG